MTTYDWKAKWQGKTKGDFAIHWIVETPDGFAVMQENGGLHTTDKSGRAWHVLDSLLPIIQPPRNWASAGDVDPAIDRIKYKRECDTTSRISLGAPVVCIGKNGLVVCSVLTTYDGSDPEPMAALIAWKKLDTCEYRRIGETTWRPCTCHPEGGV